MLADPEPATEVDPDAEFAVGAIVFSVAPPEDILASITYGKGPWVTCRITFSLKQQLAGYTEHRSTAVTLVWPIKSMLVPSLQLREDNSQQIQKVSCHLPETIFKFFDLLVQLDCSPVQQLRLLRLQLLRLLGVCANHRSHASAEAVFLRRKEQASPRRRLRRQAIPPLLVLL